MDGQLPLFTRNTAIALVLVGVFSFLTYFVLAAYAPEQDGNDGRATVLSRSAIGYAGLAVFLRAQGIPVTIDRGTRRDDHPAGVLILTPEVTSDPEAFPEETPTLLVLPKWQTESHPDVEGWVRSHGPYEAAIVERLLETWLPEADLTRRLGASVTELRDRNLRLPVGRIASLQTIRGPGVVPYITDGQGGIVLGRVADEPLYVLTDPDIINTHGLRDVKTARVATQVLALVREDDGPVVFDTTLNGLQRSGNLLRLALQPPFLGITICAVLAALLMALHAAQRFGTPRAPERIFAFGKRALAENSAALIAMTQREPAMIARYAIATRDAVAHAIGIPPELEPEAAAAALRKVEQAGKVRDEFASLLREARAVSDRKDALWLARRLYRWRVEMMHGRK
jgi:hypothetical protein